MPTNQQPTKRAKTLSPEGLKRLLAFAVQRSRVPASDRLKILLSFGAGLRACEIARMKVKDMVDVEGRPARPPWPSATLVVLAALGRKPLSPPLSSSPSSATAKAAAPQQVPPSGRSGSGLPIAKRNCH